MFQTCYRLNGSHLVKLRESSRDIIVYKFSKLDTLFDDIHSSFCGQCCCTCVLYCAAIVLKEFECLLPIAILNQVRADSSVRECFWYSLFFIRSYLRLHCLSVWWWYCEVQNVMRVKVMFSSKDKRDVVSFFNGSLHLNLKCWVQEGYWEYFVRWYLNFQSAIVMVFEMYLQFWIPWFKISCLSLMILYYILGM